MIQTVSMYPTLPITRLIKVGKKGEATKTQGSNTMRKIIKEDKFTICFPIRDKNENQGKDPNYLVDETFESTNIIDIVLPMSRPRDVLRHFVGLYDRRLNFYTCRGNCKTAECFDPATNTSKVIQCPCNKLNAESGCKPKGMFYPRLPSVNDSMSCSALKTTSWTSIRNIENVLKLLYLEYEDLRLVPNLKLAVSYQIVYHNGREQVQPISRLIHSMREPFKKELSWEIIFPQLVDDNNEDDIPDDDGVSEGRTAFIPEQPAEVVTDAVPPSAAAPVVDVPPINTDAPPPDAEIKKEVTEILEEDPNRLF